MNNEPQENDPPDHAAGRYVSDAIVDLLANLGCRYLPLNPGASFRGLHDSLVHSDRLDAPEIILCTHEEIAVAASHAYAKAVGDVAYSLVHDLVGLQHASMAVYDAWCDVTPMVILGGGGPIDPARRRPVDWFHSANTQSQLVRPFVKWDSDPTTAQGTLDAIVHARRVAGSAPQGPVYVTIDAAVQEDPEPEGLDTNPPDLRYAPVFVPRDADVRDAARLLTEAELPLIIAGRVGATAACTPLLVELMELLAAPGRDERNHSALPTEHPLCINGDRAIAKDADVILAVDLHDMRRALENRVPGRTVIDLSMNTLLERPWANAASALPVADVSLLSDARAGLELLVTAVRTMVESEDADRAAHRDARRAAMTDRVARLREQQRVMLEQRWDETPISIPRLIAESYAAVEQLPWLLTLRNTRSWPEGIWKFDRGGRYLGHSGGGGMGYGPGALLGGGLAARDRGEFAVGIIGDGDFMFAPGALWTAVHHQVPMLVIVNNNTTYLNDEVHQAEVARHRGRDVSRAHVGVSMTPPIIDFGALARAQGAWAPENPVTDPNELATVLADAVRRVQAGAVAVVDVHTAHS